ncbi:PAS-domain containing protein [Roseibium litorale]|uniref:histidine kinase n=1 Tax=Roseibium litorale TaxID=2803841 RepID=A0ABR9CSU7_9HYPH|nr:PAS-domain containing protein [Roseibium litorale]MBD8893823.1 PAS-domain containing protein [Roseibium litorale]
MEETSPEQSQIDLLQAALDHVNQGFSVFDKDLKLVAWNRGLWEMLDFPPRLARRGTHLEEFLRVNAERGEYGPGDIEGKIHRRVERARLFEPHYFERIRPNGQIIAVSGTPLPHGGFVTTYADVTEDRMRQQKLEKTVEERTRALRQSEDWLRLVTDNIPALIAYMAPGPVFRFANRRYAEWFGQSVASIVGKPAPEVVGEQLFSEIEPHVRRAFEGNAVSYEYNRERPDGTAVYMRSTLIPDMTLDGRTLGVFVLSLDATEHKRSEAALMQSQRMDAVGKLTGGLAHDFNNLLTILMGNLLSLSRTTGQIPPEDLKARIAPMLQATQRGSDLTQHLLAFSRGKLIDPQTVRLQGLINNVETLLRGSLPSSIKLSIEQGPPGLAARIDPTQLETALINLAFNARDALSEGGDLIIRLETCELSGRAADDLNLAPGAYARITVSDTGTGMDEATRLRVFEPFFTTKTFGTGSGLGLSMVYGFVTQSGGAAAVTSAPGQGTRISLYLPAVDLSSAVELPETSNDGGDEPRGSGELVLLVEDNADVATVLAEQLRDLGYMVLLAESAEDALQLAASLPEIRCMLSDIVMPGQMNGVTLARSIRSARPDLGIILMTGYADWGMLQEKDESVGFPVLSKPIRPQALAQTLRNTLSA